MDCFPDYCLGCDSEAVDGLYCSEVCRMNDLERSNSASSSPRQHSHFHQLGQHISPTSRSSDSSTHRVTRPDRTLSTSSSHSSLASSTNLLDSEQAAKDISVDDARALQGFFNAFDRTRYEKRRPAPATYSKWGTLVKTDG